MNELSNKQQMLLSRYLDNECGWFDQRLAEMLLARSAEARRWLHTLQCNSEATKTWLENRSEQVGDLWLEVADRLVQEERSEVFLGRRQEQGDGNWFDVRNLYWGAAGATFAAMLAVIVTNGVAPQREERAGLIEEYDHNSPVLTEASDARGTLSVESKVREPQSNLTGGAVALVGGESALIDERTGAYRPGDSKREPDDIALPNYHSNVVEVDWLRSDGRVRMLQGAKERVPIIWVRRRTPAEKRQGEVRDYRQVPMAVPVNGR